MKPYTRSIVELFDGKKRYLIPLYQRQYAWKISPQLDLLWEDIERAVNRLETDRASLSPHFMGALVISQIKTFGKEVQAYEVIDGQQRLTTFQLLLAAIRDVAATHSSRYADEIQKYLLNDGVMADPEREHFKLWPSLTDRRSFASIVDPAADLDTIAPSPTDEDGVVRRSVGAHEFFKAKVVDQVMMDGEFQEDRLERLFEALKEGLAAVSIELEGGDDPQTIFETLNSRGVDLSAADLLRNFIFQRAKGLGLNGGKLIIDDLYEKHWLPLDRAFWAQQDSRGRQTRTRLDWMLTDHLSMQIGDLVSIEGLFESYRRWILDKRPFPSVEAELTAISATAAIEKRLFEQNTSDPLGKFGLFADAFDVSTAMPLVVYLATEADVGERLGDALDALESFILRRDICGLTTKNYNRFFTGIIGRLRDANSDKIESLLDHLAPRNADTDRWPADGEFRQSWIGRAQYKNARQPRLRYLFAAIEKTKRTKLNEDIEIKSALSIEHIMPQSWRSDWPVPGFDHLEDGELDPDRLAREMERDGAINTLGNLTLLTSSLNSSVSNGPYSVKMPAVRAHSSLALNRDLSECDHWDESAIADRATGLFNYAAQVWKEPAEDRRVAQAPSSILVLPEIGSVPDGTRAKFKYQGVTHLGKVQQGLLVVDGQAEPFSSFSAASRAISQTSRNGWNDWELSLSGAWTLANEWRKSDAD